ncbi:MAG: hypothetical protein VW440_02900 [Bordetella sp.]
MNLSSHVDAHAKELAQLIQQGGHLLVVDAALISPTEREQIARTDHSGALLSRAIDLWEPGLLTLLSDLSSRASGDGCPEQPPERPQPSYALLFEAAFKQLGLLASPSSAPWAYWQALEDGITAETDDFWMALEPCQWQVSTQQVQLQRSLSNPPFSPQLVDLVKAGLEQLEASFVMGTSGRGYLRFKKAFDLQSAWPESLEGLSADDFLPQGGHASRWRQFVTELEMALAMNPDSSPTQSLWPWGLGQTPNKAQIKEPYETVQSKRLSTNSLSVLKDMAMSEAPLAIRGLHRWLVKQGQAMTIEWRNFKQVQTVEDWLSEWHSLVTHIQTIKNKQGHDQANKPWAVLLQDEWTYKLYIQPHDCQIRNKHFSSVLKHFGKGLRGLARYKLPTRGRKTKDNALTQLLALASWMHGDKALTL